MRHQVELLGRLAIVAAISALGCTLAIAAPQAPPSAPVTVVNTPGNPVPVTITNPTGNVTATVSGAVESADQNVVVFNGAVRVDSQVFQQLISNLNIKDFKEVRVIVYRSGCGPCSTIEVMVKVEGGPTSGIGASADYPLDSFTTPEGSGGVPTFATRTYTTPGETMHLELRATGAADNFRVLVLVVGRAN